MTYYPPCITDAEICNKCYASESCTNCVSGSGNHPCSAYCNTGCNTVCNKCQTFCELNVETCIDHADVKDYPEGCWFKDEFIFKNWTAKMWNDLITYIDDTAKLGVEQNQGTPPTAEQAVADPLNSPHPIGSLVTAKKYNQQVARINFFNKNLQTVVGVTDNNIGDVIREAHALALKEGYETMTFNTDVCDVCNAGDQNRNSCNCSCDCSCTCSCDCSCDCGCDNSGES